MKEILQNIWSATRFNEREVSQYAEDLILPETRHGLMLMAVLLFFIQGGTWLLQVRSGAGDDYFYTFCILGVLSAHIFWSARYVRDSQLLHMLAIAYVVLNGTAMVMVAHETGTLHISVMSSAVLLIVAIPLVPWGLKEALTVCCLIYALFTLSLTRVEGRFDMQTIWTLQFLFLAATLFACALVVRNVRVRKSDIRNQFHLDRLRRQHEHLARVDPLTGAFNRRQLEISFGDLIENHGHRHDDIHLTVMDVNNFKHVNDRFGHHAGDRVLQVLARCLHDRLGDRACVIRMGGDEFAVLYAGKPRHAEIDAALQMLATDPALRADGIEVSASSGSASTCRHRADALKCLYHDADEELYRNKREYHRRVNGEEEPTQTQGVLPA